MAFTCGFYNAVNHDRTYDATQFGDLFTGLINDGVYATVGHCMTVAPVSGMTFKVRSGRAWFNRTWNVNDSDYPLTIPESDLLLPRIDAVILEVDTRLAVRNNSLKVVSGRAANNPTYPELTRANGLYQYPLAYVNVRANVTNITTGDIEVVVGRDPTPFVTGIISVADISDFWEQWDSQFHEWFDELRTSMSGDVAVNLQAQIEALKVSMITNDSKATTQQAQQATNDSSWMTPSKTLDFFNYRIATQTEANAASVNNAIMTPLRVGNFFNSKQWAGGAVYNNDIVSSYKMVNYIISQAATDAEVTAGTATGKYVSPATLNRALANYQPSGGSNMDVSTGNGTLSAHSNAVVEGDYLIRYCHFGPITIMYFDFCFASTVAIDFLGFTISGLPAPTHQFVTSGVLTHSMNPPPSYTPNFANSNMFHMLGNVDAYNTIDIIVEHHGDNDSDFQFQPTMHYGIAGTVVYY